MRLISVLLIATFAFLSFILTPTTVSAYSAFDMSAVMQRMQEMMAQQRALAEKMMVTTSTPRPTSTATIKPSATATPRATSTPTPKPTVNATPKPTSAPTTTSDSVKDFIMNAINDYRRSQGLSSVRTDSYTCDFAKIRAKEISTSFNHDGFRNRINNKTLPYPGYSSITENIAMTSNYQNVVNMWINSSGHAENMRKDTPFVCVERYGNYYAYEGWKP